MRPDLRDPNFYLLGFMGAGKSTIGPLLAEKLQTDFFDLDTLIEDADKATVRQIFDKHGEAYFRRRETEMLLPLTHLRNTVVALGGGTFTQDANRVLIRSSGVSIWLDVPFECIQRRIQDPYSRPLFRSPQEMEQLFNVRAAAYRMADLRVPAEDEAPAEIAARIVRLLGAAS